MRGENYVVVAGGWNDQGSPPLARGKLTDKQKKQVKYGITPACAGKTNTDNTTDSGSEDHPRLRGENLS